MGICLPCGLPLVRYFEKAGLEMISSLALFILLTGVAILSGNQGLRLSRCQFQDAEEEIIFSCALGLVFLSYMILLFGVLGLLDQKFLWVGVATLGVFGLFRIPHFIRIFKNKENRIEEGRTAVYLEIIFWVILLAIGVGALVPPFDTDGLTYHLSIPREFLRMRRVAWIPSSAPERK